jgi:hypothetical protein
LYDRANASIHVALGAKRTLRRLDPVSEKENQPFQLSFNQSLKVDFQGSRVTSDSGLLLVRELDERLGLSTLITENIMDDRRGKHTQLPLPDLLRQSGRKCFCRSGFRTEGGDAGEKVLHVDASLDRGDNGTRLLWSSRRSRLKRPRVNE